MQLKLPKYLSAIGSSSAPVGPDQKKAKQEDLVGLDVSASGIAAARISDGRIRTASVAGIANGFMSDGEVADPAGLGEALADFFGANGMPKRVRMGVASPRVVIRTIELPVISDRKQFDAAVRFQAQDNIPMPLSEAVLDYQVMRTITSGDTPKLEVMLVAASKGLVSGLSEAAKRGGLKLQGIDLSAFALIRVMFPGSLSEDETIAYVHFGDMVNVTLAQGKVCRFTRATTTGFEEMVSRICERGRLTRDHARMWIDHVGLDAPITSIAGDAEIIRITRDELESAIDALGSDVSAAIDFHSAQDTVTHVSRVLVSGQGSAIPGLAGRLGQRLNMSVEVPAPLGALDTTSIDGSGLDNRRVTLAAGLAIEEVVAA